MNESHLTNISKHPHRAYTIADVVVVPALSPQHAIQNISNVHGVNSADALACAMCSCVEACGVPVAAVCTEQCFGWWRRMYRTDW
jgi:hypothetical protein